MERVQPNSGTFTGDATQFCDVSVAVQISCDTAGTRLAFPSLP